MDLSSLNNTGTDDQNISGSGLSGTVLTIGIEGGTSETVELSSLVPTETDPQVGANTTNYLPKWNGSALVQSSSVFEDGSGNVGIGTSSPKTILSISRGTTGAKITLWDGNVSDPTDH